MSQSDRRDSSNQTNDGWTGYQWNIPLDEVFDCDSAPQCCRECYYRHKGMSKKKQIVIIMLFMAATIVLTALVVRFSFGSIDIILGAGNQRPITNEQTNFSPLMCSQYLLTNVDMVRNPVPTSDDDSPTFQSSSSTTSSHLSSDDRPVFDAYMLLDLPYRSYRTNTFEREERLQFPDKNHFNYRALFLDSGSAVTVNLIPLANTTIQLWIVEGKDRIDDILSKRKVDGTIYHTFTQEASSYNFDVYSSADDYAFIFTILETRETSMTNVSIPILFTISLKELVFDDEAVVDSCFNATHCSLLVPASAASVMIEVNQSAVIWPITLRTECKPDIGMYLAFFLGVPVGSFVFILSCAGVLYLCQESVMRDVERADRERADRSQSSQPTARYHHGSSAMSRSGRTRRTFRNTMTSHRARLVDHDVLDAPPSYESPPAYQEIDHVSLPAATDIVPVNDVPLCRHSVENPPSYDSIVT